MKRDMYEEAIRGTELDPEANGEIGKFIGNIDMTKENALVPKKPARGEYIYCQWCGKIVYPQQLSKDPKIRAKEIKWQYHYECKSSIITQLDNKTPGLQSERRMFEKRAEVDREIERRKLPQPRKRSFMEMSSRKR